MTEKFKVLNDYTLQVSVDMSPKPHRPESYELTETAALRRIFNFRSAQVTTIMQQSAYIASDYSSEGGAGVTAASQMSVQNFDDIQSQLEIEFMHAQLKKMGGNPPALEDLRGGFTKKPALGRNS
jgi:hypothetical protein